MKVLLMVPLPDLLVNPPRFPDVGLGYLAVKLIKAGHDVVIYDWNQSGDIASFTSFLKDEHPDLIGIKVFTKDVAGANATIKIARNCLGDIPITIGGPHASAIEIQEAFMDFPEVDYIMQGEAEASLNRLAQSIVRGEEFPEKPIEGLVTRNTTPADYKPPTFEDELDKLDSPAWRLFDPSKYLSSGNSSDAVKGVAAPIVVTRGCPAGCTFCCAYRVNGLMVRARSAQSVLDEIEMLVKDYRVSRILISDTNFLYFRALVEEICEGIIRRGLKIKFNSPTGPRIDLLDDKLLSLLSRAGCEMIGFGIESCNEEMRRKIKKLTPLQVIEEKARLMRKHGIHPYGYFLFGFLDETREQIMETFDKAFRLPLDGRFFEVVYPLPGTETYEGLKCKYNIERINWSEFDLSKSPYTMSELSQDELFHLVRKAQLKTKLNLKALPATIVKVLKNPGKALRTLKKVLYLT